MNLTGYDVATPGNHDFDWGVGVMRQAVSGAAFPYVSGNIYTLPGDTLLFQPYVILQRGGADRDHRLHHSGAMVWNRDQVRGRVRVESHSCRGGAGPGAAPARVRSGGGTGPQWNGRPRLLRHGGGRVGRT